MTYVRLGKNPAVLAALFAVYFVVGKLGLALAFVNASTSAISPSAGIALAGLLVFGYRVWPAILFGSLLVNVTAAWSFAAAIPISIGSTLEALLGAYLVNRFAGGRLAVNTAQGTLRFCGLTVLASSTVSATCGVVSLSLAGFAYWADYGSIWMTWWLANLSGALLVAPLVMLWSAGPWVRWRPRKYYEAAVLLITIVLVGWIVFAGLLPDEVKGYPLEFVCVPVLLWAAFRFGRREVATAVVILSGIAVWGTLRGNGPFVRDTRNASILLLQAFMSVTAVMSVALAALVSEYAQAEAQLRELAVTDALTGLPNYRKLLEVLRTEIVRSDRSDRPFALLFLDMDGLKIINDEHGHLAGSRAVCRVAETLRRSCRKTDTSARFGGDEFVVVLPETEETGARLVAQRISERLASDGDKPPLSVSAGVAVYPRDGGTPATLLSAADRVLYEAKGEKTVERKPTIVPMREWSNAGTGAR
jgi:diguanylate cyclase (GGDEF)-like protein